MIGTFSGNPEGWNAQIRTQLEQIAEPKFRQFTAKLLPGTENILGVRDRKSVV